MEHNLPLPNPFPFPPFNKLKPKQNPFMPTSTIRHSSHKVDAITCAPENAKNKLS